jgi:hypothetical protein
MGRMNLDLLIDSIVRQTTVLIAQLATATGGRYPLAHTANQVLSDLIRELKEQGLGNKVIADMFGLTLRTYHNRVRRLAESSTFKGRSIWEAVLSFVQERGTLRRADILARFVADDERVVRAVLSDLVDSGVVFRSGRGDHTTYRAAAPEEMAFLDEDQKREGVAHLVHVAIARFGPLDRAALVPHVRAQGDPLDEALSSLVASGRVNVHDGQYSCEHCVIPFGEAAGWEAAVFDHYQAMVTAICIKLRRGKRTAALVDSVGGSTYTFDIWRGHPMEAEVLGVLGGLRGRCRELRERVEAFNREHGPARDSTATPELRVITYVGQGVLDTELEEGDSEW